MCYDSHFKMSRTVTEIFRIFFPGSIKISQFKVSLTAIKFASVEERVNRIHINLTRSNVAEADPSGHTV